jgi:hypothetical protein
MISSIIDVPRQHDQNDLFGINVYQDALIDFIKHTDTPITIALQGEWGSGKTSLMNLLRWNLCDDEGAPFYPIWINTWQYSLMKSPNQAIMSILDGIINQIGALNPSDQRWNDSKKKIGKLFKKMAKVGTQVAVSAAGFDGGAVAELFEGEEASPQSDISQLKDEIESLIADALEHNPAKKGFTFYIDDLDRIDPPVAVEILELLKNIFDLKHCVFILAIDYDVVIKGLKPKFGELTDKNEREFRSFFDKIIQLPFSMPVASYNIDTFLVDALKQIEFFTDKELEDPTTAANLSEIARLSVGCNPRSLKRLTNTLSLISIINRRLAEDEVTGQNKILNFALVCTQIAYPYIYNQLTEEPDFKQWNDKIASKLKLRPLSEDELKTLDASEEFDEEWEKVTFRMCQKETFLSMRAFQVSGLLNKMAELVDTKADLGEVVAATLEMSAVTNIKAFDTPKQTQVYTRQYWVERSCEENVAFAEKILEIVNSTTEATYQYKYNKGYFGFNRNGSATNFMALTPRRRDVSLSIKVVSTDEFDKIIIEKLGGRYNHNNGWYSMSIKNQPDKNDENFEALKPVIAQAEKEYFKK